MNRNRMRIGEGWDSHRLVPGRPLVLGGVTIPHTHGLDGHSDADALCHAITDAIFGALALLAEAGRRALQAGWHVVNVDSTIVAQAPKMAPHILAMRQRIAQALAVKVEQVSVKAKTAERLGPVGAGESMEARAVCLLYTLRRPVVPA